MNGGLISKIRPNIISDIFYFSQRDLEIFSYMSHIPLKIIISQTLFSSTALSFDYRVVW